MNQGLQGWPGSELLTLFPGIIVDYYGDPSLIRTPWALCDGTNGTVDLRDKFIVGAGSTYALGATGGAVSASYTPAGTVSQPSFTGSALAPHGHANDLAVVAVGDHTHGPGTLAGGGPAGGVTSGTDFNAYDSGSAITLGSGVSGAAGAHAHSLSGGVTDASAGTPAGTVSQPTFTGAPATIATLPPYFGLYKIQYLGFGTA